MESDGLIDNTKRCTFYSKYEVAIPRHPGHRCWEIYQRVPVTDPMACFTRPQMIISQISIF